MDAELKQFAREQPPQSESDSESDSQHPQKQVRFRANDSVYSVDCEYASKNKALIDEQLRDDLSEDDFENNEEPCSPEQGMQDYFKTSHKNFFKPQEHIEENEEEFRIVSDEREDWQESTRS